MEKLEWQAGRPFTINQHMFLPNWFSIYVIGGPSNLNFFILCV